MANTTKKIKDPTEAALSAIQDALSARDAAAAEPPAPPAPPVTAAEEPPSDWRTIRSATLDGEPGPAEEPRLVTQSMAEVAMRLAEPETVARESIVTVGQAIRREVAAMGNGVERALARAAELETLVANEVSALEHAYNDNEVRIRALLQDLGSQRDSLVGQAAQIRDAINGVHLDLSHDISQVSELVAEQVNEASRRITHTLAEKAEHITRALGHAGDTMIQSLGERGGDLLDRLENTSRETSQAISAASDRPTTTLNFKTDHIGDEFGEITANIQRTMSERLDRVTDSFAQKATEIIDIMG